MCGKDLYPLTEISLWSVATYWYKADLYRFCSQLPLNVHSSMVCYSSNKGVTLRKSPKFLCLLSFHTSHYSPLQHLSPSLKPLNSSIPSFRLFRRSPSQAHFHLKAWPHLPPSDTSLWPLQNTANSLHFLLCVTQDSVYLHFRMLLFHRGMVVMLPLLREKTPEPLKWSIFL